MTEEPQLRSGNEIIDKTFDWCVDLLLWGADLFGISYFEINIWIFCIIWPLLTLGLIALVIYQLRKINQLKNEIRNT